MPNETQQTAMMILRDRLQAKITECGETPRTQYALGFKEALEFVASNLIDTELLEIEKQQRKDDFVKFARYVMPEIFTDFALNKIVDDYFNQTFNQQ